MPEQYPRNNTTILRSNVTIASKSTAVDYIFLITNSWPSCRISVTIQSLGQNRVTWAATSNSSVRWKPLICVFKVNQALLLLAIQDIHHDTFATAQTQWNASKIVMKMLLNKPGRVGKYLTSCCIAQSSLCVLTWSQIFSCPACVLTSDQ